MSDNGMMTKVWGPPGWLFLHCITFGYPVQIDELNQEHIIRREHYRMFFKNLGKIFPCKYCRESYDKFILELPIENFLNSREKLTYWFYLIHNKVNKKLGVPKCNIPSFEKVKLQYESYRAKCSKTTDEQRKERLAKGCVIPKDGKKKRSYIKVIGCKNNNEYMLVKRMDVYVFSLLILLLFVLVLKK